MREGGDHVLRGLSIRIINAALLGATVCDLFLRISSPWTSCCGIDGGYVSESEGDGP